MMDLAQARSLFAAMKPSSTLILVGDPDQLTSVAAGAVLMDIVDTLTAHYSPQIVGLTQVFRAEQHLVPVNEAVRIGDPVAFAAAMGADPDTLTWRVIDTRPELDRVLREWSRSLVNLLHTAGSARQHSPDSARGVLSAVAGIQLLCALRETRLKIALVESNVPTPATGWDVRVYAISPANAGFLQKIGAWKHLDAERIAPIYTMKILGDGGAQLDARGIVDHGQEADADLGELERAGAGDRGGRGAGPLEPIAGGHAIAMPVLG